MKFYIQDESKNQTSAFIDKNLETSNRQCAKFDELLYNLRNVGKQQNLSDYYTNF